MVGLTEHRDVLGHRFDHQLISLIFIGTGSR